jgi:hypothetical protein
VPQHPSHCILGPGLLRILSYTTEVIVIDEADIYPL